MPRERRIRVRGKQRSDIDLDLLVQALLMIGEERMQAQQNKEASQNASPDAAEGGNGEADA